MKISIITVSFNSAKTIRQTIESVLSQDYDDLEYIVVDGASKDGTVDILKEYEGKIKYISEPDKGIYDALNKGVKLAKGEVIGTIGGDDFYPNTHVISHIAKAFQDFKTDAIYGDKQYVNIGDDNTIVRYWRSGEYQRENWLKGWNLQHPTNGMFQILGDQPLRMSIYPLLPPSNPILQPLLWFLPLNKSLHGWR